MRKLTISEAAKLTKDANFEEDLPQDVLEIITVFAAKLYESRSHTNKKIVEELRAMGEKLRDV